MEQQSQSLGSQQVYGTSVETLFLLHYLQALQKLQDTFLSPNAGDRGEDGNPRTCNPPLHLFNLQLAYILALIPDHDRQNSIKAEMREYKQHLKTLGVKDDVIDYHAGFYIVTEIIKFLNSSLDLTHTDIIGDVCEIPDTTFIVSKEAANATTV